MSPTLRPAEEFRDQAGAIFSSVGARLKAQGIPGELFHVGGTSVAGALTKGDVDLHLRTRIGDFTAAVAALTRIYTVTLPEIWCPTLATFEVAAELPVGLAVTPIGSEHDLRFSRTWLLLAADPELVTAYNRTKHEADAGDYEDQKSRFFDHVLTLWSGEQSD